MLMICIVLTLFKIIDKFNLLVLFIHVYSRNSAFIAETVFKENPRAQCRPGKNVFVHVHLIISKIKNSPSIELQIYGTWKIKRKRFK